MNLAPVAVSAVIPVFNGSQLLSRLLDSVERQATPFTEIIVVDNGSTDGAPDLAAARGCRVVHMGRNTGFACAGNRGWQVARTPWVAILNSDVELAPDWLSECLRFTEGAFFITGLLLKGGNRSEIDGTYDLVSRAGCAWRAQHGRTAPPHRITSPALPIAIAPATACLYRREVLRELGGFEEGFESYLEDVDLGLRCLRAGHSGFYVPSARAIHAGSATWGRWNNRTVRLISRNQVFLLARHYHPRLLRRWLWPILVGQALWGLVALRHGAFGAWARGKWEGLRAFRNPAFRSWATPSRQLEAFLERSEEEIRSQGQESYWLWYFRLSAPPFHSSAPLARKKPVPGE